MIGFSKKKVSRTGIAALGWALGHGHVRQKLTVQSDVWCVTDDGKVLAECRSQGSAEHVASALKLLAEQLQKQQKGAK